MASREANITEMLKLLETTVQNLEKRYGPVEITEETNVSDAASRLSHDTFTRIIRMMLRDKPSKFYDPRLLTRSIQQIHPFNPSEKGDLATQLLVTGTQNIFKEISSLKKRDSTVSELKCDIEILRREVEYLTQLWKEVIAKAHRGIDMLECQCCHMTDSNSDDSDVSECDCAIQN